MQNVPNRRCELLLEIPTKVLAIWAFVLSTVNAPSIRGLIYALEKFRSSKLVNGIRMKQMKDSLVGFVGW